MPRLRRSWFGALGVAACVASMGTGCASMWARSRVSNAISALESADAAGAKKKAPYEYAAAQLYLEKAREAEAYAHFGPAIELADLSSAYSEKATLADAALTCITQPVLSPVDTSLVICHTPAATPIQVPKPQP